MGLSLPEEWARFLTTPLPWPKNLGNVDDITKHGNVQLRAVIESSVRSGVLPKSVLLAQFIHVIPGDLVIDLEIPTLVDRQHVVGLLHASAIQGSFVKKTRFSFFRSAVTLSARLNKGIICSFSNDRRYTFDLENLIHAHVSITNPCNPPLADDLAAAIRRVVRHPVDESPWDYVRGLDLRPLLDITADLGERPKSFDAAASPIVDEVLGGQAYKYLWRISPWMYLGHLVLCTPSLYYRRETPPSVGSDIGGGGVLYVVQGELSSPLLWDLYAISHRMCSIVSGIWDTAKVVSQKAEAVGYQRGEYMISHEMDTPLGILEMERGRLTPDGQLALDYLQLWRRFVKREWSDALPNGIDEAFHTDDDFFQRVLFLAFERAQIRNVVPKRMKGRRVDVWEREELLRHRDQWIDLQIEIPDEVRSGSSRWSFQVKCWLLFLAIGALHHAIKYAFKKVSAFENWDSAKGIQRAEFRLSSNRSGTTLRLCVQNAADEAAPEDPVKDDYLRAIRSNHLGRLRLPPTDGCAVTINPFRRVGSDDSGRTLWTAEIVVEKDKRQQ